MPLGPLWAGERRDSLFLYLHVPFCEQRCGFCNLFTRPVPPEELIGAYLRTLARQVARRAPRARRGRRVRVRARRDRRRHADAAHRGAARARVRADPRDRCDAPGSRCRSRPRPRPRCRIASRSSSVVAPIGSASACRASSRASAARSIARSIPARSTARSRAIRDAGPATLNIDLMYGLPGQTAETWRTTMLLGARVQAGGGLPLSAVRAPADDARRKGAEPIDQTPRRSLRAGSRDAARGRLSPGLAAHVSPRRDARPARCTAARTTAWSASAAARARTRAACTTRPSGRSARAACATSSIAGSSATTADFAAADYGFVLDEDEQRRRWLILSLLSDEGLDLAAYRAKFGAGRRRALPRARRARTARLRRATRRRARAHARRPRARRRDRPVAVLCRTCALGWRSTSCLEARHPLSRPARELQLRLRVLPVREAQGRSRGARARRGRVEAGSSRGSPRGPRPIGSACSSRRGAKR